jgi:hypothetical protein
LQALLPQRVSGVVQSASTEMTLFLQGGDEDDSNQLRFCWNRKVAHVCLVDEGASGGDEPSTTRRSLATTGQDLLGGLHLVRAQVLGFSRVLRLDFSSDGSSRGVNPPSLNGVAQPRSGGEGDWEIAMQDDDEEASDEDSFAIDEDLVTRGDHLEEDAEVEPVVTAHIYYELMGQSGAARLVLVGTDHRVVTAAPPVDRAGNVWQRIGRRYIEPSMASVLLSRRRNEGGDDTRESTGIVPDAAEPTLLESQDDWEARVRGAHAQSGAPAGSILQALLQAYQGLSPALVKQVADLLNARHAHAHLLLEEFIYFPAMSSRSCADAFREADA